MRDTGCGVDRRRRDRRVDLVSPRIGARLRPGVSTTISKKARQAGGCHHHRRTPRRTSRSLSYPIYLEEVGCTRHAWIVSAHDALGIPTQRLFAFVQIPVEVVLQVVLDVYLVLGSRNDHVVILDHPFFAHLGHVIEKPPGRLDQPDSRTGPWRLSNGFFVDYSYGSQDIDSVVDALQD